MSSPRKDLETTVKDIIQNSIWSVDDFSVELYSLLFTDLGADDMDYIQIAYNLEKDFDISITNEEFNLETMQTVKDVCDFVEVKLKCKEL